MDDVLKTTLTYTGNTAGWQTWTTVTSAQFNIAAGGTHKVKLVFPGNNMNLNWIKFVPQVSDATPPSVPGTFAAPVRTNTGINFTWAAATDAESGIAGYDVVIDGGAAIALGNVTAYSAYGFAANSTHTLKVQARNGAGLVSGYPATAFSATTTNAANLLTNGDFSNGNTAWTLYQGTNLNVAGEYAVSTPVTANVYDVNVYNKVAMTQGQTYTLTFRARSNLNRTIVGGWGLAQTPWTSQNQTYTLSPVWQNYSVTLVSTVPSDPSSRVFYDVAGAVAGEVHIDDVVLSVGSVADNTPPSVPAGLASPSQTNTTVNLSWTASTDNVGVTGYDVFRDGALLASPGNVTAYQATGLVANTAYSFQVRAKDAAGNLSALCPAVSVTTANLDVTPPTAPATLSSPTQSGTTIDLAWPAATDNVAVVGYDVMRLSGPTVSLANVLNFQATGLVSATSYSFQVRARDAAGNVSPWGPVFTVATKDVIPPSVPAGLVSPAQTATSITVAWAAASDNVAVTGYDLAVDNGAPFSVGPATNFTVQGLAQGAHNFQVRARDAAGNVSNLSAPLTAATTDATPPTAPSGLAASNPTNTTVNLAWTAATDNIGVTGYNVYNNGTALLAQVGAVTAFQLTGLTPGTAYALTVVAKDAAGNLSPASNIANVTTTNNDTQSPSIPTNLASPSQTGTTISLTWTASTDNVGVAGYDLVTDNGLPTSVGNVTAFTAAGFASASSHMFMVRAYDAAGNVSGLSAPLNAATTDATPPSAPTSLAASNPTNTTINLAWTASTDNVGVTGYNIYNGATLLASVGAVTATQLTGLTPGTAYALTVVAKDAAGNLSPASNISNVTTTNTDTQSPTTPTNLASPSQTGTTINLTWTASTDNIGVAGYDLIIDNGAPVNVGNVTAYTANGFTSASSHTFQVRARDAAGNLSVLGTLLTVSTLDIVAPTAPALSSPSQANTTINLAWTAATDNVGVTAYEVSRGGVVLATLGNVLAYQATGLTAGTAYSFTVRAKDAAGNFSGNSNTLNVSTTNASPNLLTNGDFSNGFTGWTLYQGTSLNVPGEYAVTTNAGGNAYDVNVYNTVSMTQGVTYTLTFKARSNLNRTIVGGWGLAHTPWTGQYQTYNLTAAWQDYVFTGVSTVPTDANSRVFFDVGGFAGEVHIDNVVLTNAAFVDNQAPTVPAGVNSPAQGQTSLNIAWTASTDNVGVTGYEIFVNGTLNATVGAVTTASITGLAQNTTYSIQVRAFDAAGNRSTLSTAINAATANGVTALKIEAENWTQMTGLQTENTADVGGGLNVGWIDANDWAEYANQPLTAGNYVVEARMATMDVNRMVNIFVDGQLKTTVTQATATGGWQTWTTATSPVFNIAADGNHLIRAQFPGNNMNLNWIRFVPQAPDATPPSIPTGLASTAQGGTTLTMSWNASTDAGSGVAGYRLFANGVLNATTGAVTTGTLTGLAVSTQYQVTVKAFDNAGNESGASAAVTVSTTDGSSLNGLYVLRDRNSGKCVEVAAGGLADGAAVIQNNCDGSAQQKWTLTLVNGSVYKLMNQASGKILDVKGAGSTNDVQQWTDNNGAAQQWRVLPVAGQAGHYTLNATSDLTECLDVLGASQAAGAAMQTLPCAGAVSQQFAFIATQPVTACVAGPAPTTAITFEQWWAGVPLVQPMELVQEPTAAGNWVIVNVGGVIKRVNNNRTDNTNNIFLDITGRVATGGENGMASLAFDPDYATNRFVYITYVNANPKQTRLSRFTAVPDFSHLDPNTEVVLFRVAQTNDIHHSGSLVFGPGPVAGTKYLYVTIGDNGSNGFGDVNPVRAQQLNQPYGKVLRFNPAEYHGGAELIWDYTNGTTNDMKWIMAIGLRNPWRTSFDGNEMWNGNVGSDFREEVNKFNITEGVANFGWPWCEGRKCCDADVNCNLAGLGPKPADNLLKFSEFEYPKSEGNSSQGAVVAGFVYHGSALPALVGQFIFADFVDGTIFSLDPVTKVRTTLIPRVGDIADIGQDRDGEIMLTDYGASKIWKIIPGAAQPLTWPPANLIDAGCFASLNENDAVSPTKPGVSPFEVAQKFWSDSADKQRYISLPPGATVDVNDANDWKLPPGGVTIKTFKWPVTGKNYETRFFVRHTNGAYAGYTYKWTSATTATLVGPNGDTKDLGGGMIWNYPTRAQCMVCHNDKVNGSIALETRQINYHGQLASMSNAGILNPPNPAPLNPFPNPFDDNVPPLERATSYLHVNCATCHRGPTESAAGRATWDARYTTPLAQKNACNVAPFDAISGDAANERIIKPGNSGLSTIWLRAHIRGNNSMPPLATQKVDQQGVQMLADWMNQLTNCQ